MKGGRTEIFIFEGRCISPNNIRPLNRTGHTLYIVDLSVNKEENPVYLIRLQTIHNKKVPLEDNRKEERKRVYVVWTHKFVVKKPHRRRRTKDTRREMTSCRPGTSVANVRSYQGPVCDQQIVDLEGSTLVSQVTDHGRVLRTTTEGVVLRLVR